MFGHDYRVSVIFAIVAVAFVFIVVMGRILSADISAWAIFSFAMVASVASVAIGFLRRS